MSSHAFDTQLIQWYADNTRELPWKEDRDPYKIWVSEIILQQTRVEQGTPYYLRFINAFPTIKHLADADIDEVLKLWEGLGYYSRARNMHFTAKHICDNLEGKFPNTYEEILKLKGIGPYTAAAISSFAYGLSHPVVDGNVLRLITRYYGINNSIDLSTTVKEIRQLLQGLIKNQDPAVFNQAIMDYGATVCKPKKAFCTTCVMADSCYAYANNKVHLLPTRTKKIKKKKRYFFYYYLQNKNHLYIHRREGKGIWQGLYEFPAQEVDEKTFLAGPTELATLNIDKDASKLVSKTYKHILTHQLLHIKFINCHGSTSDPKYIKIKASELSSYALPRVLNRYLEDL